MSGGELTALVVHAVTRVRARALLLRYGRRRRLPGRLHADQLGELLANVRETQAFAPRPPPVVKAESNAAVHIELALVAPMDTPGAQHGLRRKSHARVAARIPIVGACDEAR